MEFEAFPKIPRLRRSVTITEKIDGTNAQIAICDDGAVLAGSRTRWIAPGKLTDNYGFAQWVKDNEDELRRLGPGRHFGEWWGAGVQRRYGRLQNMRIVNGVMSAIPGREDPWRTFSLFNTQRWGAHNPNTPACCSVVPVLYNGDYTSDCVEAAVESLRANGSRAEPGFMRPEGVVVFMASSRHMYKVLLDNDDMSKNQVAAAIGLAC